jgi:hypothetical protein
MSEITAWVLALLVGPYLAIFLGYCFLLIFVIKDGRVEDRRMAAWSDMMQASEQCADVLLGALDILGLAPDLRKRFRADGDMNSLGRCINEQRRLYQSAEEELEQMDASDPKCRRAAIALKEYDACEEAFLLAVNAYNHEVSRSNRHAKRLPYRLFPSVKERGAWMYLDGATGAWYSC